jgi:hypothetical protein
MNGEILSGYHATDINNIELIKNNGFIESEASKGHWLGRGIYFFENLYYAVEWEIIGVIKHEVTDYEELTEKCGIIIADLDMENYKVLDLSEPQGYAIFEYLLKIIKENYPEEKYEYILSKGYAYAIKILEQLEIKKNKKYISKFDVICAAYPKNITKRKTNLPGDFISCVQKQMCVKNPNAIKKVEELQHSDITKGIFNLVKKNRGEKND